jgi:hypothetical protein
MSVVRCRNALSGNARDQRRNGRLRVRVTSALLRLLRNSKNSSYIALLPTANPTYCGFERGNSSFVTASMSGKGALSQRLQVGRVADPFSLAFGFCDHSKTAGAAPFPPQQQTAENKTQDPIRLRSGQALRQAQDDNSCWGPRPSWFEGCDYPHRHCDPRGRSGERPKCAIPVAHVRTSHGNAFPDSVRAR